MFGDLGKPKFELNSERGSGFWDLGGLYCSVVEELEEDVVEKPAVSCGAAARNAAPHQNPSLKVPVARAGGIKSPRKKNTMLK